MFSKIQEFINLFLSTTKALHKLSKQWASFLEIAPQGITQDYTSKQSVKVKHVKKKTLLIVMMSPSIHDPYLNIIAITLGLGFDTLDIHILENN